MDAVRTEAHGLTYYWVKQSMALERGGPQVLRRVMRICRKGGMLSVPGVYGGFLDKIPFGAAFAKGLTIRMGQTHVMKYLQPLLDRIEQGEIDPSFVITHRLPIDDAPNAYQEFRDEKDNCIKAVME